ncbi:carboxyvinyl-carboxyphosphonate phosphorylmutase [Pseudoroseomonas deserti]|uniref:Carboxyvinyl-carboxyphosphonate phosphorylmutase n=1 Tax=Teichococcus deserti TaxID=1817963 RepID=A0A1V2H879_9PROT|nr:isocitrate lyase/PEP mutase family protein [Pseudoroseomonas deserti]ONG58683.1 carboxyvinyl-carboxyphosphonate phosphorylmutase [Pseudoroseomonas deserti]
MADKRLKEALAAKQFIVAPGIFDMISARIADRMGFSALYATGYGTVASHLGVPDAGIATFSDMVSRMGRFAQGSATPVIADADTGYGGLLNVRHTVMGYEAAGIAAIQLEDQEVPKKCGHTPGRRVIPAEEMALKIEVAAEARKSDDFLIIARTDARTTLGLDEAIRRGKLFRKAGADIVFIESPETEDEMKRIGQEIDAPLLANNVDGGGRTPILSAEKLASYGYDIAIYPALGFLTVAAALERSYAHLKAKGVTHGIGDDVIYDFAKMNELMGFPEVWDFDRRWTRDQPAKAAE